MYTYFMPTKIIFGQILLGLLSEELKKYGKKVFLVSGRGATAEHAIGIKRMLEIGGFGVTTFFEVEPNPDLDTVRKGVIKAKNNGSDIVVAVGGGSPIDAAKAISAVLGSGGKIEDILGIDKVKNTLPLIAIPTTSGTGSEVTKYAILTNAQKKVSIVSSLILPQDAFVDPELTMDLPISTTIDTGLDALSHLLEGFFSRAASPISDAYAKEGLIWFNRCYQELLSENNYKSRESLSMASLMGGLTINTASSGLAHAIGYPLTSNHQIPHGRANALIMPHLFLWQKEAVAEKYNIASNLLGFKDLSTGLFFLNQLSNINPVLPNSVSLNDRTMNIYADEVINNQRFMQVAPKQPKKEDIVDIYRKISAS